MIDPPKSVAELEQEKRKREREGGIEGGGSPPPLQEPAFPVNISSGPLAYTYRFHELHIHYGTSDGVGSEHTISGYAFPAEIQIFGFNANLYQNFSEALTKSQGVVGIAIMLQEGEQVDQELRVLTNQLSNIRFGANQWGGMVGIP
ncbi:unnamed protein product [Darwinula stevensoni]|uniref:Alpha-carbonic anhydrase domain-containing protein n=1 Tax=Darwinula stevensoni TaxID=69355 RepID=A0A7R8X0P9_9CRUS|nr:unnamed protein product [Darwinula stevensoni]CAG0881439.1 unnamed protein product [Darwinula stevensoni]